MTQPSNALAVFDFGKTNTKLFVFAADGRIVDESRTKPVWRMDGDLRVLDEATLFQWMEGALRQAVQTHDVGHVMFSGHGCTFALVNAEGLTHPILDYEQEVPREIAERIDPKLPSFAETFTPLLPLGFNVARHMLWVQERQPQAFARADAILSYSQYWTWRFSRQALSEVSYLGCHSYLWAPLHDDFSSLVDAEGWRSKMPALARAGAIAGSYEVVLNDGSQKAVAIHNGVHDSNASLYLYRSAGLDNFTLISTGTWVVIFNSACPLDRLDETRDMLANVTVDHQPAATIRFMGGREFDVASGGWNAPISADSIASVITKSIFALPSFAAGGPVPDLKGRFVGTMLEGEERAAAALLYVMLMTDLSLDLIASDNDVIIDGGLAKAGLYPGMLAQLRPQQRFLTSDNVEGSASGAAALAFEAYGLRPFKNTCAPVAPSTISGLDAYRREWRAQVEAARHFEHHTEVETPMAIARSAS